MELTKEDILKYGTQEEVKFLTEAFTPDPLYKDLQDSKKRPEILTQLGLSPQEFDSKSAYDVWKYLTSDKEFVDKLKNLGYLKLKIDLEMEPGPKPTKYAYLTKKRP
jgi:hypothetical protein